MTLHTTPDPLTEPVDFDPPHVTRHWLDRWLDTLNRRDRAQAEAAEVGRWCREQGPRRNRHGLFAPGDAR